LKETHFPVGTVLENKFRLEKLVGMGAAGVVYLGYDLFLQRHVAIKVLRTNAMHNRDHIKKFRQEAITMATIKHLNVVQIFSFGEKDGYYYFVMEYIAGQTLEVFLQDFYQSDDKFLSLDVAIGLISQICSGLSAVHNKGIAHRDVKPGNVLISKEDYHIALTDFGLTSLTSSYDDHKYVEGTPLYLAPERIKSGKEHLEFANLSDIYAVGCVFYEMLSGQPPYYSNNVVQLLSKHLSSPVPSILEKRPELPIYVERIINKAMAKNPENRYQSCKEFKKDLLNARMPQSKIQRKQQMVLVFDDGKTGAKINDFFSQLGAIIEVALIRDYKNGIDLAFSEKPDAIIVIERSDFSLLELCSILSELKIPIYLFIGDGSSSKVFIYRELGVEGIYSSTLDIDKMGKQIINKIL
jgi:serine/threonine protein kinase